MSDSVLSTQEREDQTVSDMDELARQLEGHEDFRVLRRFRVNGSFGDLTGAEKIGSLCVLDFETTGVEESDRAIELGMIRVEYDRVSGRMGRILDRYSGLEDPGFALPENIVALTGLTDEMVRGKHFDDAEIERIVASSAVIVAHNAQFDRGFGERRFAFMATKPWACSRADVPWDEAGISSTKLEYIAYRLGFFYDAHRAVVDCEVTAGVLNHELMDGRTGLHFLLGNARRPHYRVWATGAPYATKGVLKARGYEWRDLPGSDDKAWRIETTDPNEECDFLKGEVFKRDGTVLVEEVGPDNRFTTRRARFEAVQL